MHQQIPVLLAKALNFKNHFTKMTLLRFLKPGLILYFFLSVLPSAGQVSDREIKELVHQMDNFRVIDNKRLDELLMGFERNNDTSALNDFLYRLEKEGTGKSKYFRLRILPL